MTYQIYILRTSTNELYIGHSNKISRRIQDHGNSLGAKFVKDHGGQFEVVYTEVFETRADAMNREKQLKKWTRAKKEALIAGELELLKKL
jgi:predicted GIY-YIG superfamily endonuclease